MQRIFRCIQVFLLILSVTIGQKTIAQGGEPSLIDVLDGGSGTFKVDSFATVEDAKWWNATEKAKIDLTLPYSIRNIVTLKFNEESTSWIASNFTTSVAVRITYTDKNNQADSIDYTFAINYDSTSGIAYNSQRVFTFNDGYKVTAKILSINTTFPSGVTAWDVSPHLRLENEMQIQRYYNFNCSATPSYILSSESSLAVTGDLIFYWIKIDGATEYDFEWTYIDSVDLADGLLYGSIGSPDYTKIFEAGSSRVTVYGEQVSIPLLYDRSAYIFCRLRGVQLRQGNQRIEGAWFNGTSATYNFKGHETGLNWQSTTTFAEETKRKSVVHYFDGSLKERQVITKDNDRNITTAAETFYDYQGRPAIQVLPAPRVEGIIKYVHDLNKSLAGGEYEKSLYDSLLNPSDYCSAPSPAMSSSSGANRFYSSSNDFSNIYSSEKAVPAAFGYAFAETRYAQDNTGRVMAQGGVGQLYQPGNGHETKYYYGKPDQQELDALFGTEVGEANHYQKNMVRDANGQYSVSYIDMSGRTVATALAGKPDSTKLDTLVTYNVRTMTKRLNDPSTTILDGKTMQSSTGLVVTSEGLHTFRYTLSPDSIRLANCDTVDICYDCVYNLEISISDECNNQLLPFNQRYVLIDSNFTLGSLDTLCNGMVGFDTTFSLCLTEGAYTISKKLSIAQSGYEYYRDSVFMKNNLCKTFEDFYQEQLDILQQQCDSLTCESCTANLGTYSDFKSNYILENAIDTSRVSEFESQIQQAYAIAKADCDALCDSLSEMDAIKDAMLLDMTPEFGQYANPEVPAISYQHNIFYKPTLGAPYNYQSISPRYYVDEDGKRDSIFNSNGQLVPPSDPSITSEEFIAQFKPSWAEALLPIHPEYCRYEKYSALRESLIWDTKFQKVNTYAEAKAKGYLNPINEGSLPFLPIVTGGRDPLYTVNNALFNQLKSRVLNYQDFDGMKTMWGLATATSHCVDETADCFEEFVETANAFDSTRICRGDLDMAWRAFQQFYLTEKRRVIMDYLVAQCPSADLIPSQYVRRFPDLEEMIANNTPASTDPAVIAAGGAAAVNSFYASNCEAYAASWWNQLARCNFNGADSAIIYAIIMPRLIQVCKEGSDASHPLGSSTIKPGSSYTFNSFDAVIKHFLDSAGRTYNASCNGYLITAPPPYEHPASYASLPLWTKPDSCQCAAITSLHDQYVAQPAGDINFSAFVKRTKNADISETDLQQLLQSCSGGSTACKYFEQPIVLPPALQCGFTNSCVGCDSVNTWHSRFVTRFGVTPDYDDNDSVKALNNRLYGNYMNFHSGFNKTYVEYMQFRDSCTAYNSNNGTCDSLRAALDSFRHYYYHQPAVTPGHNADGCDTTTWKFLESMARDSGYVRFRDMFDNGVVHVPDSVYTHLAGSNWADSMTLKKYALNYEHPVCNLNNAFTWEMRLKSKEYTGAVGVLDGIILYMDFVIGGSTQPVYIYLLHDYDGGINIGTPYASSQLKEKFGDFKKVTVKVVDNKIKVYIDGQFRAERSYTGTVTGIAKTGITFNYTEGWVDYSKFYSGSNGVIMEENFANACDSFAVMNPLYDCSKLACDTAFAQYYNSRNGTSYSTGQLQQQFITHCGREAKPCQPYDDSPTICSDGEIFNEITIPDEGPCSDTAQLAYVLATEQYNMYRDSLRNVFDSIYSAKCMKAYQMESFTVEAEQSEFHYTLYYYDRAGNLVKTVPPAGVDHSKFGWMSAWSDSVKTARNNSQQLLPSHQLVTNYRFNTLNQPVAQHSPDGGSSKFWYDRLGRIALSQNARQQPGAWYSYTLYDSIGRMNEVGEFHLVTGPSAITDTVTRTVSILNLVTLNARRQITSTYYDLPYAGFAGLGEPLVAKNLRTRVAYSTYTEGTNPVLYDQGSFYSYDIHGNVDTLLQDYRTGAMNAVGHRFKKMVWDYDLVSGKVNRVAYQPGKTDQFYHRYLYDSENRLTQVLTSADSITWERDALYKYLVNGPLARVQLGQQKVQGVDHAYTLQGWLKAINGNGTTYEVGLDGTAGSPNTYVAKDAYAVTLHYHSQDYSSVLGTCYCIDGPAAVLDTSFRNLYNGNITGMGVNIPKINYPESNPALFLGTMYYNYKYDQLNRITGMDAYTKYLAAAQAWPSYIVSLDDYRERVSYDANGNILKYSRNGTTLGSRPLEMDKLTYKYYAGTNQLRQVRDSVNAANYTEDIDDQSDTSNYVYDAIGNMIRDKAEGIDSIKWNVYGKIMSIHKSSGLNIWYTYDAGGNRVSKKTKNGSDSAYTWYARDASGNVLSVYRIKNDTTYQDELHLYGSSRIGMIRPERNLILAKQYGDTSGTLTLVGAWKGNVYRRGQKFFELANHLGNVLVTISDKKLGIDGNTDGTVDYYMPDVVTANDYYPFGMGMPERRFSATSSYRYGFNGKENDNEVKGEGGQQDYGMRIYDPRLGKFLSVDPLTADYPWYTPYQFAGNMPIWAVDLDGLEPQFTTTPKNTVEGTSRVVDMVGFPVGAGTMHKETQYYHRGSTTYNTKAGWYTYSDYVGELSKGSFESATSLGTDLMALGFSGGMMSDAARHSVRQEGFEGRLATFFSEIGEYKPIFFDALSDATKLSGPNRNKAVWGGTYPSAFNVEDLIGVGLLLKGITRIIGNIAAKQLAGRGIALVRELYSVSKSRNIATLGGEVDNVGYYQVGISGQTSRPGAVATPVLRKFTTKEVGGYDRAFDSEAKLLEDFAERFHKTPNIKGTLTLTSERQFCGSCEGVISQFQKMFPNIKLNQINGVK